MVNAETLGNKPYQLAFGLHLAAIHIDYVFVGAGVILCGVGLADVAKVAEQCAV